jgi:hypothetical protein
METRNPEQAKERMVHVSSCETMHKKVRIRAAETDQTIQDGVFAGVRNVAHRGWHRYYCPVPKQLECLCNLLN